MGLGVYREIFVGDLEPMTRLLYKYACNEAERSKCRRRKIGAASYNLDASIGLGFNSGCEGPCVHEGQQLGTNTECNGTHAERELLDHTPAPPLTLVVTTFPCMTCAERIVQEKVESVYFRDSYGDNKALGYLLANGVDVYKIKLREE